MSKRGDLVARAAEDLVGSPFKLNGRDPRLGIDCVGLVLCALRHTGGDTIEPEPYKLRNLNIARQLRCIDVLELDSATGGIAAGDVMLFRLASTQYHLGVVSTKAALIHAHVGLRRVVASPLPIRWRIERHWRVRD